MIETESTLAFDVQRIRADFPILEVRANDKPLVYFDNGASSQKPRQVIDAISNYYETFNANIHRGVHFLSQQATAAYEQAREKLAAFINASSPREVIFTAGTTASINLVAQTWGRTNLKSGDEVLISAMEHHGNIVPWQMICEQTGALLRVIPMDTNGELIISEAHKLIGPQTRILALSHVSNALGSINPVKELTKLAKSKGATVLIDGAQAVPHFPVDVQEIGCDFYAFSGHKMLGPTGIGILYGREELLNAMPPWQGGGDMIKTVTFEKTTYNEAPLRFEAGTPNIGGAIALAAAVDYFNSHNRPALEAWEKELLRYARQRLSTIEGLRIIGTSENNVAVVSFIIEGLHPYDVGFILDRYGIAVRTGHHCAQPLMDFFCIPGTLRASFAFYNTREEIDSMVEALHTAKRMLS